MDKKGYTFELLPVDDIILDFNNPRIAMWVEMYGTEIPAEQIALALGAGSSQNGTGGPSFISLKNSILTNRGIIHPILVNRESSKKLTVIEGNTRTQIYREFKSQNIPGSWDRIPAMVYSNMSEEMIDSIRLQAHLVGARQWDPYSKAKYLYLLRNKEHLPFAKIIDFCGGNKREINNYIQAYIDMEKHYRSILESDQDFDHTRFSAFIELQSTRVIDALLNSNYTKDDFARWVHEKKLYPLEIVRKLPRILQNTRSRDIFLRDGAQEALKVLETATPEATIRDATLEQLAGEICKRISRIEYGDIQRLRSIPASEEKDILCEARDALMDLCDDIFEEKE
ncbi:MAG: hypothetical protein JXI43_11745 [Tissierellales bacterium]|nr:hypothetical protein [Tissierellales bacterium]